MSLKRKVQSLPRAWLIIAVTGTVVAVVVASGANRTPPDSSQLLSLQEPVGSPLRTWGETLHLASFNIHGGKGTDDKIDLNLTASLLGTCDLGGLYEVRLTPWPDERPQSEILGDHLGRASFYAPTEHRWWRDHFGNGLLLSAKPESILRIPLPGTRGKAFRNAILVHVPWKGTTLHAIVVHIDREQDRERQLDLILPLFLSLKSPSLLMGDLNTRASDPRLQKLLTNPDIRSPLHDHLGEKLPADNIDWIFTSGLETLNAELIENEASDHPVLRAELKLVTLEG